MSEYTAENYLRMFNKFFSSGRMSSTYKAIFLRSLLDLGNYNPDGGKIIGQSFIHIEKNKINLDLDFIAIRFLKYYWDMHYSFKIRQSQDPNDANILKIIKRENIKYSKPPTLEELDKKNMSDLRTEVIKKSIIPEIIPHLKNDMPGLYNKIKRKPIIELDHNIILFLKRHNVSLKNGINYKLATYLERINKTIPQIANKIDIVVPRQHLVTFEKKFLKKEQNDKCFYCGRFIGTIPHFDHVIPFNYIYATDLYNSVMACRTCNGIKSDKLPIRQLFDQVLIRNEYFTKIVNNDMIISRFSGYAKNWYEQQYVACDMDYRGSDKNYFTPKKIT